MTTPAPPTLPSLVVPKGWGMHVLSRVERVALAPGMSPNADKLGNLYDTLLVWEPPRRSQRYVMSVDVSDGVGQDRSVIDITRVATITEPDEQVAQFVTKTVDPIDLAAFLYVIGWFYKGADNLPAVAAIETNGHGLTTQAELQKRWGYPNFFVWQYENKLNPENRFATTVGWVTTQTTRRIIMTRYLKRVKSWDEATKLPDYKVNSPFTITELRTLRRPADGSLGDSESDPNDPTAHDDCVMAGAIGVHVCQTMHYEEGDPIDEQRRRGAIERQRREEHERLTGMAMDYHNTDLTLEEIRWARNREGIAARPVDLPWE